MGAWRRLREGGEGGYRGKRMSREGVGGDEKKSREEEERDRGRQGHLECSSRQVIKPRVFK